MLRASLIMNIYRDYYTPIGQFIDLTFNYIQVGVVAFAIYMAFSLFIFPYSKPLAVILKPLGMDARYRFLLALKCNKKSMLMLRIFIERACIESKGEVMSALWWSERVKLFKEAESACILVENSFSLTSEAFAKSIKRYFDYYRLHEDSSVAGLQFISSIKIKEGYLAPMSFISGLEERYQSDWQKILNNFHTTLNNEESDSGEIIPSELYFSYAWLMWGPSYQNDYAEEPKSRLILYGYGDEANSVNVIVKGDSEGNELWKRLNFTNNEERNFGFYGSITGKLVDTYGYSRTHYNDIAECSLPFFSRISQESFEIPFALELHGFVRTNSDLKRGNHFFSAYLWIMFMLDGKNFSPERTITLFEHANLPDLNNYRFLAKRLIDKVFDHFRTIADRAEYTERKYRYCLSMNKYIESLFMARLSVESACEGAFANWLRANIEMEPVHRISVILDSFDSYFVRSNIREIFYSAESNDKLGNFYVRTYFPQYHEWAERQTLELMLRKLTYIDENIDYHLFGYFNEDDHIIGFTSSYFFKKFGCGVIEDLLIDEKAKNKVETKQLIDKTIFCMEKETERTEKRELRFVMLRVSAYMLHQHSILRRWNISDFHPVPFSDSADKQGTWLINRTKDQLQSDDLILIREIMNSYLDRKRGSLGASI